MLLRWIAFLNAIDGVLTYIGLSMGKMLEGNPLMEQLYQWNPLAFLVLKLGLSVLLSSLSHFFSSHQKRFWFIGLSMLCFVYVGIIGLHGVWILEWLRSS